LQNKINFSLSEPEASLANAIFLGYKKNLPSDLQDNFSKVGISHVMAISGMHIGIISVILMSVLIGFGLKRKHAFYFATFILILYIIIIGFPASAMRAGFMGFLVLWALNLGRLNKITNSIFLTAFLLLLINPKLFRDDIGFQLSFLAVLGIIYFYPFMSGFNEKVLKNILKSGKLLSILKVIINIFILTISAQILTLPIVAYNFSGASLISPVSNLLIIWILPFLLVGIMIALVLSLIIPSLSILFFIPVAVMLKYIIFVSNFLVNIPYAYIEVNYFAWWWMALYYLIIMLIFYKINIQKKPDF
jgi:competence protein ComEC